MLNRQRENSARPVLAQNTGLMTAPVGVGIRRFCRAAVDFDRVGLQPGVEHVVVVGQIERQVRGGSFITPDVYCEKVSSTWSQVLYLNGMELLATCPVL